MKISELIKALQHEQELHGDVRVRITAEYDCGYYAGNDIDAINFYNFGEGSNTFVELYSYE